MREREDEGMLVRRRVKNGIEEGERTGRKGGREVENIEQEGC